jgi:hypothetical protein
MGPENLPVTTFANGAVVSAYLSKQKLNLSHIIVLKHQIAVM